MTMTGGNYKLRVLKQREGIIQPHIDPEIQRCQRPLSLEDCPTFVNLGHCVSIAGMLVTMPMTSDAAMAYQTLRKRILTIFP